MPKFRKKPVKQKKFPLELVLDKIWEDLHSFNAYAGGAYLRDEIADMNFWRGQYIALERLRKFVADLVLLEKPDVEIQKKTRHRGC